MLLNHHDVDFVLETYRLQSGPEITVTARTLEELPIQITTELPTERSAEV